MRENNEPGRGGGGDYCIESTLLRTMMWGDEKFEWPVGGGRDGLRGVMT